VGSAAKAIDYDPAVIGARLWTSFFFAWLAILSAYLVFIGGGWPGIYSVDLRTMSLNLIAAVLAVWFVVALLRPDWRPRSQIFPGLVVCIAVMAISTLLSRQPRLGYDYLAYSVLLVALYFLLVRIFANPTLGPRFMALVVILAIALGITYVIQVVGLWFDWWRLVGRLTPPPLRPQFASLSFGNPSAVMTVSILLALPAIAHLGFRTRGRAITSGVIGMLALFCTIVSGSRAGWVGLAIGFVIAALIWLALADNRARLRGIVRSRALLSGLAVGAVAAVGVGAVTVPGILFRAGAGGENLRFVYYDAALRMFAESPLHGTGPGTWVAQRAAYTDVPQNDYYIPHAHNVFLQTLAESGLLGAAAGAVVAFFVGRLLVRTLRSGDSRRLSMAWTGILGLAYFGGHQLLDFYANMPAALFAIAIPIAWLDAADEQASDATNAAQTFAARAGSRLKRALAPLALGASICVVAVGWLSFSESWASAHAQAVDALNRGRAADALAPAQRAVAADPGMPAYQVTLGLAAADTGRWGEAAAAIELATRLDDLPASWLGLADARANLGDTKGARSALAEALRLGVVQPSFAVASADLEVRLGDRAAADDVMATAIAVFPVIAGDPSWGSTSPFASDWTAIVDQGLARIANPAAAAELALIAGRGAVAKSLAESLDSQQRDLMLDVIAAWDGDVTARMALYGLAEDRPFDLQVLGWASRIADRAGQAPLASEYRNRADLINAGASLAGSGIKVVKGSSIGDDSVGWSDQFYGHYTYRRPTPWILAPDDLPMLIRLR
jgi:tetratricopeptide (TPR) repeat protein